VFFLPNPQMKGAACKGADPKIFFSGKSFKEAKKLCKSCPVKDPCLEGQLEVESRFGEVRHGIWGGLTAHERDEIYGPASSEVWESDLHPEGSDGGVVQAPLPSCDEGQADWAC
jgi:WhiB family redox-sensing transcriptional regulator